MSYLDNLVNNVKGLFGLNTPARPTIKQAVSSVKTAPHLSAYDQTMAKLDQIQKQLNPYIQNAQKNASIVDKYVTSHQPVTSGNYASAAGGMYPLNKYNDQVGGSIGNILAYNSNPQPAQDDPQLIGQLGDLIRKQHAPLGLSADISPYLSDSTRITSQRHQNEQALLGASYG